MPLNNIRWEFAVKADYEKVIESGFAAASQNAKYPFNLNAIRTWATGVGANQADLLFADQRTLAASTGEDLDLAGVLADAFGATLTFVKLRGLYVEALSTNTNNVRVSRPATNGVPFFAAAGDEIVLHPGGVFMAVWPSAGGIAVTAATGDLIRVDNSGAGSSVVYNVAIIGSSS